MSRASCRVDYSVSLHCLPQHIALHRIPARLPGISQLFPLFQVYSTFVLLQPRAAIPPAQESLDPCHRMHQKTVLAHGWSQGNTPSALSAPISAAWHYVTSEGAMFLLRGNPIAEQELMSMHTPVWAAPLWTKCPLFAQVHIRSLWTWQQTHSTLPTTWCILPPTFGKGRGCHGLTSKSHHMPRLRGWPLLHSLVLATSEQPPWSSVSSQRVASAHQWSGTAFSGHHALPPNSHSKNPSSCPTDYRSPKGWATSASKLWCGLQ